MVAKRRCRTKAASRGYPLDRQRTAFQQLARPSHPFSRQPNPGTLSDRLAKPPMQRSNADGRLSRQARHRPFLIQVRAHPIQQRPKSRPASPLPWHGTFDVLRLTTLPMGRQNQAASHLIGDLRSPVAPDKMQTQIQPGGTSRRGQDTPVIHVKHIRHKAHPGIALDELVPRSANAWWRSVRPAARPRPARTHRSTATGYGRRPHEHRAAPRSARQAPARPRRANPARSPCLPSPASPNPHPR